MSSGSSFAAATHSFISGIAMMVWQYSRQGLFSFTS